MVATFEKQGSTVAVRTTEYDHVRLSREADLAGQSFAFEDAPDRARLRRGAGLWTASGIVGLIGLMALFVGWL